MRIDVYRGECRETVHPIRAVAICDGQLTWQVGPPTRSPWRSAAKPLQLWCSLEAAGDPPLAATELALGASSHSGQPFHVEALRALMARLGVEEAWLKCGAEPPAHRPSAEALIRAGLPALAIHNDCSGKHTLMLAACRVRGWDLEYRPPEHPLQRRITQVAEAWCGEPPELAVDGCGVPVLCLSIEGMARAWARIAGAMADDGDPRLGAIGRAMAAHPRWTSGDGRLDLAVVGGASEPMAVKIGAAGVFCIALPERRLGIAIKCLTGDRDALATAVAAVLERAAPAAWSRPASWPYETVRNVVGHSVGRRVAVA